MGHCLFMRKGETHTAPISGILASDLAVGSSVYLMEDGVATEYLVVNQGKPSGSSLYDDSCDGTWLLRKRSHSARQWHTSTVNDYENSEIHSYMNGEFFNLFGSVEQAAIKQVKIPYRYGSGYSLTNIKSGESGLSAKVFLLSCFEVGYDTSTSSYLPTTGAKLEYFALGEKDLANELRKLGGISSIPSDYWFLRDPYCRSSTGSTEVQIVYYTGTSNHAQATATYGIRPALILPSSAVFDDKTLVLKGVK